MAPKPNTRCVLCNRRAMKDDLIAACDCDTEKTPYRMHVRCLEKALGEHASDERLRCYHCKVAYEDRVSTAYQVRWTWGRLLSCRSVGHCFEFGVVIMMICCSGFALYMFSMAEAKRSSGKSPRHHTDAEAAWVVYALFGSTLLLVPLTLVKVYRRWYKANAEPVVLDIV